MRGAFRSQIRGFDHKARPLVLVDDVLTAGATMTEAITCLQLSGLEIASFFVFARAGEVKPSVYKGERDAFTQSKID